MYGNETQKESSGLGARRAAAARKQASSAGKAERRRYGIRRRLADREQVDIGVFGGYGHSLLFNESSRTCEYRVAGPSGSDSRR